MRRSRWRHAWGLLALPLGLGLLLPEASHTVAHRHAAAHEGGPAFAAPPSPEGIVVTEADHGDGHSHLALAAAVPAKASPARPAPAPAEMAIHPPSSAGAVPRVPPDVATRAPPASRDPGPSSRSRPPPRG